MKATPGLLEGTVVFEPTLHRTPEGFQAVIFDAEVAAAAGIDPRGFVEESQCRTSRGAVMGLRVRTDGGEGLLVRCAHGAALDVAVDLRPGSATYRLWMTVVLDDVGHRSVWLPPGLAHGFQALSEVSDLCLRTNRVHRAEHETTIRYDDPDLGIPWPLTPRQAGGNGPSVVSLALIEPLLNDWFGALQ